MRYSKIYTVHFELGGDLLDRFVFRSLKLARASAQSYVDGWLSKAQPAYVEKGGSLRKGNASWTYWIGDQHIYTDDPHSNPGETLYVSITQITDPFTIRAYEKEMQNDIEAK